MPPKTARSTFKPPVAKRSTGFTSAAAIARSGHDDSGLTSSDEEPIALSTSNNGNTSLVNSNRLSENEQAIPRELLARLMHDHFAHQDETKIEKGAMDTFKQYIEIFIREAVARAAAENSGTGFLEVRY